MVKFNSLVKTELEIARQKHANINSAHEGFAVILEELDEFWEQVRLNRSKRDRCQMLSGLVQIAAMAQRTAEDLNFI
jgi:hypothetical protein